MRNPKMLPAAAIALLLLVALILWSYHHVEQRGYARGRADQTVATLDEQQDIAQAKTAHDSVVADSVHQLVRTAADSVHRADSLQRVAASHVKLRGDTAEITRPVARAAPPDSGAATAADTTRDTTVAVALPPEVAERIRSDDVALFSLRHELTLSRLAAVADSVQIADLRAQHVIDVTEIRTLKQTHGPRFRFIHGLVAGAGVVLAVMLTHGHL